MGVPGLESSRLRSMSCYYYFAKWSFCMLNVRLSCIYLCFTHRCGLFSTLICKAVLEVNNSSWCGVYVAKVMKLREWVASFLWHICINPTPTKVQRILRKKSQKEYRSWGERKSAVKCWPLYYEKDIVIMNTAAEINCRRPIPNQTTPNPDINEVNVLQSTSLTEEICSLIDAQRQRIILYWEWSVISFPCSSE